MHDIAAVIRDPAASDQPPEVLEAERDAEQKKIDEGINVYTTP